MSTLYEYQFSHFTRLLKVYEKSHFALDSSATGCGKTIIAITLAKHFDMKLFVICPNGAKEQWLAEAEKFGASDRIIDVINYEAFAGRGLTNPKHGYVEMGGKKGEIFWSPTKKAVRLVRNPLLLVYDEAHYLKNRSRRADTLAALSRSVLFIGSNSKIYCSSATPFDKKEHATNMMFSLGVIPTRHVYLNNFGHIDHSSFDQYHDYARKVLPKWDYDQMEWNVKSAQQAREVIFSSFTLMMKINSVGSFMQKPEKIIQRPSIELGPGIMETTEHGVRHTRVNLYGSFETKEQEAEYTKALREIEFYIKKKSGKAMAISNLIHVNQRQKTKMLAKYVRMELNKNPNRKVIVFTDMVRGCSLELCQYLSDFRPLFVTGQVRAQLRTGETISPRQLRINAFNMHNNKYRLMIMTTSVGGQSLNLHDTDGRFPRSVFILPSWNSILMNQAMGRHCRASVKSDCRTFVLYGPSPDEKRIFDVLHSKGDVLGKSSARDRDNFVVSETVRDIETLKIVGNSLPS